MAKKFLTGIDMSAEIDLNQNELRQARVHNLATAPSNPVKGQIYFNTANNRFYVWNGTAWDTWGTGDGTITGISSTAPIKVNNGTAAVTSGSVAITHDDSGVTANTYGTTSTSALTPAFGATFAVPGFTVNAKGHVTAAGSHTVKMPSSTATSSAAGLMSAADKSKLDGLTSTMQFKGTLGTDSTATYYGTGANALPAAADSNKGWTVKVIADVTSPVSAKNGDTLISDGSAWILIPSGDEPSGTVTSIAVGTGLTASPSPITSSGTISHSTSAGYKHVPDGGSANQYLEYGGSAGTAAWETPITNLSASGATSSTNLITAKAVADAIAASQAGTITPEQISRTSFTIASGSSTGSSSALPSGSVVYSVCEMQGSSGVVTDWSFSNNVVTATLASNASSAVTVNVLYYSGGTIASTAQADYVIDMGTDNYWTWRKWNSGWAEAWGHFDTTFPAGTTNNRYGNLPKVSGSTQLFVYDPVINANVWMESTASATVQFTEASVTRDQWTVYIQTTAGSGDKNTWIYLHLIGRWQTL